MARVNVIKTNMTAGELSPRLMGRVDIARFQNAVATMENAWPLKHGGARRRTGSRYIAGAKFDLKKSIVRPFIFSSSQSYALEFGDLYMRVFKDLGQVLGGGGLAYEIATLYAEADLPELNYAQSADTMFLFHPTKPTVKLTRSAHASWKQGAFPFTVEAHDEVGITPNTGVTLSAATVGVGRVATAAAATFLVSDVGRKITSGDGVMLITAFTDTLHVTGDISTAFASVNLAALGWTLDESPKTGLTPSATGPIGTQINLTLDANGWQNDAVRSCVGNYVHINGGVVQINGVTTALVATGIVRSVLLAALKAGSEYWSEESKIWTLTNGYPRCGTLFEQRLILAGTTRFPNTVWGSKSGLYGDMTNGAADDDGFSFTMASDQQNPVQQLASIKQLIPLTYGGEFSVRGGIEKPITPTNAQVKSESTYGIKNVRPVRVGTELLFVQRAGRKLRSLGYQAITDNFVSPDISVLSEHITEGGISELAYAQEPDSLLAMVRADGQMPTLTIDREQEVLGYARQVTDGLVESACSIPYQDRDQVWAVVKRTINGVTKRYIEVFDINADFTQDRMTDASIAGNTGAAIAITAIAWAAGVVTVTCAGPHGLGISSVARIAGVTPAGYNGDKTVVTVPGPNQITYALEADPGVQTVLGTLLPLAKVWTGLGHLEGKQVDLLGDSGIVFPPQVVAGGQVTYPRAVPNVEIGLHYKTTIVDLPTEVLLPEGSMRGRPVSINEVRVRLYKTVGCKVENEQVPFRKFGVGVLDQAVKPFTGVKKVDVTGWDVDRALTIVQDQPLPFCLLSIVKRVTVGD
jgi:hypothetical protein